MKNISMYDYEELREKAMAPDATKEDRFALLDWFVLYGDCFWNGEYYDLGGYRLYQVIEMDEDEVQGEVVDVEIR